MKKITLWMAAILAFLMVSCKKETNETGIDNNSDIGEQQPGINNEMTAEVPAELEISLNTIVEMGHWEQDGDTENGAEPIEWKVIDLNPEASKVMLITDKIILRKAYHENYKELVNWEYCDLRKYLNEEFLKKAFDDEKKYILSTTLIDTDEKLGYEIEDKIFMLDYIEVTKLFDTSDMRCSKIASGLEDEYIYPYGALCWDEGLNKKYYHNAIWFLRDVTIFADWPCLDIVDYYGEIKKKEYRSDTVLGVRPVMWVDAEYILNKIE